MSPQPHLKRQRWRRRLGLVSLLLALSACKTTKGSHLLHDINAPVRSASSWNWQALTANDFAVDQKRRGIQDSAMLSDQDPLAQRLQYWVDVIDASLRA